MLQMRPSCECCDRDLPAHEPASTQRVYKPGGCGGAVSPAPARR
jgi:hypothetical protein